MATGENEYGNYYESINGQIIAKAQFIGGGKHSKCCKCLECETSREWFAKGQKEQQESIRRIQRRWGK